MVVKDTDIEEYSDTMPKTKEDSIDGRREKVFVRCSSQYFGDLISELQSKADCTFDTYINDLVKDGYTPTFISILKRQPNDTMIQYDDTGIGHFRDVCASRVLNYFGCPTTYDTILDIDGTLCSCSVDFSRVGEDFYSVDNLMETNGDNNIADDVATIERMLKWYHKKTDFKDYDKTKDEYISSFVYSYMTRKYILFDGDCWMNNFGIIHNTTDNTVRMSPNYDFEYCFNFDSNSKRQEKFYAKFLKEITFVKQHYPYVYDRLVSRLHDFLSEKDGKPTYTTIIEKEIGASASATSFTIEYGNRLQRIDSIMAQVKDATPETN